MSEPMTLRQLQDTLENFAYKMSRITGDLVSNEVRLNDFLNRYGNSDIISAVEMLDDRFRAAKKDLEQAKSMVQDGAKKLETANMRLSHLDLSGFASKAFCESRDNELQKQIDESTKTTEQIIQTLEDVKGRAMASAPAEDIDLCNKRIDGLSDKIKEQASRIQSTSDDIASKVNQHDKQIADLQKEMAGAAEQKNTYSKEEMDRRFALKGNAPTLDKLNGLSKDEAVKTYARADDFNELKEEVMGGKNDPQSLRMKISRLNATKVNSSDVYSKTEADAFFCKKKDVLTEQDVHTIVDNAITKATVSGDGSTIYATKDQIQSIVDEAVKKALANMK